MSTIDVAAFDGRSQQALYSAESLTCASSLPVRMIESSRDVGWTSLLLDHQQVLTSDDEFETVPTPDQTVVVMTRGKQNIEVYDRGRWKRATYRPGVVGKTPGGESDRLRRRVDSDAGPACKINLYLPQGLIADVAALLKRSGELTTVRSPSALAYSDDALRIGAQLLLRSMRAGASSLQADGMAHWLTVHLLTSAGDAFGGFNGSACAQPIRDKRLKRVIEFMENNLHKQLTLEQLALEAAVSKFYFVRLFREATGYSPHRWLSDHRLQAARHLLETTDCSIAEVSVQCGFTRSNYFATAFTRRFGLSPSDYRLAF